MPRLQRGIAGLLALLGLQAAHAADLAMNDPAPAFTLKDQGGQAHALADYRGRWVVLYFYPKDDTPGCATEACSFRDDIPQLRALGVQILGVSVDDTESHARFADKYHLPFPLLADTSGRVATAYDSLWSLGPLRFARRNTFIIDPQGRIAKIYRSVKPAGHSREIQHDIQDLQKTAAGAKPPAR
jgi:peroxiredoxin Q/BCP